jgi:hypothetical protein
VLAAVVAEENGNGKTKKDNREEGKRWGEGQRETGREVTCGV